MGADDPERCQNGRNRLIGANTLEGVRKSAKTWVGKMRVVSIEGWF